MKNKTLLIISVFSILIALSIMSFSFFNKETKEQKLWNWFTKNQETYYNEIENLEIREKIFDELSKNLTKIHPDLVFEFSPKNENGIRELTISAEGIKEIFPIVQNLIDKSPKLKNWKFNAFRQRIPGDEFEIKYDTYKIGYDDIFYRYSLENNELGIELNIRNFDNSGEMKNAIYILLDGLLGEYDVTKSIDWIEWKDLNENEKDNLYKLVELRELVDSRKNKFPR